MFGSTELTTKMDVHAYTPAGRSALGIIEHQESSSDVTFSLMSRSTHSAPQYLSPTAQSLCIPARPASARPRMPHPSPRSRIRESPHVCGSRGPSCVPSSLIRLVRCLLPTLLPPADVPMHRPRCFVAIRASMPPPPPRATTFVSVGSTRGCYSAATDGASHMGRPFAQSAASAVAGQRLIRADVRHSRVRWYAKQWFAASVHA